MNRKFTTLFNLSLTIRVQVLMVSLWNYLKKLSLEIPQRWYYWYFQWLTQKWNHKQGCECSTYITLIEKKEKWSLATDYRPISLTTSLYKIMPKILVERLTISLPNTIPENHVAFVKGRQITYAILIANEAIGFWKSKKEKGFCH